MKRLTTIIFILAAFVMASCVPSSPSKTRKSTTSDKTVKENDGASIDPDYESGETLYWYSGATVIDKEITLNENTNTVVYIRGLELHNFLGIGSNFDLNYCLVANFNYPTAKSHIRFRAVPITFNNITSGVKERLFRIDVPEKNNNSTTCDGVGGDLPLLHYDDDTSAGTVIDADTAFSMLDFCPTCSGIIGSKYLTLYAATDNNISFSDIVDTDNINLGLLGLRVDIKNSTLDQSSSCTNSSCLAKGFDCCSNGQCVNDAEVKPNASSELDYAQALADVSLNANNFVNYPNVYFVCSSNQIVEPTPTPLPDAAATASARLVSDIADYNCLEGAKEEPAVYTNCAPANDVASFTAIRSDVWARCGCEATPFPTEPDNPQCPDFGLEAIKDVGDNITNIICYTPPPITDPTPFQSLNLNLPVRTAPHRFFNSSGAPIDDVTTVLNTVPAVVQEGEEFSYLDEVGKTDPINGSYNMNSLLGQFKIDLSRAHPAKVIDVELDQTFVIAAVSGYSTPCPQCVDDAWFNNFSSHPQTQGGNGLRWTGYTTSRSSYQNNLTNGNYEDTLFGRACWVPPTMLPFSHKKDQNVQTQRLNRLATQAAYYVNGYQRDWFGFNKGALIGSFDGVKWFAIGNGRRVTSTSTKLLLAINAPFADLAEPSNLLVNIITDLGNNTAPNFDWDPNLAPDHPDQNQGATCQYHHQCNVDSDCVSKLGWEYVCSDTSRYRSKWPKFNSNGEETAGEEYDEASFGTILQGNQPAGSANRCVYRGAGSPCKQDYENNFFNSADKEMFSCAPNFYCSSLTASDFNREVVRTPNLVEAIIFGQEADVLGRPKSYLKGDSSLTTEIRGNMEHNSKIFTSQVGDWGICRPGKRIHPDPLEQHQNNDSSNRTDYINQIASCNSDTTTTTRIDSCPVFETDEDTGTEIGEYLKDMSQGTTNKKSAQNSCGGESQRVTGTIGVSTFEQIESETLTSLSNLLNPTVPKDACLRRPGAVCHTNLDCSPSYLHEEQASFYGLDYFGNTEAEKKYWQESLICGQAQTQPFVTADEYYDYDLTKNRCCREVGKDFTMYSSGDSTIIPDFGANNDLLETGKMPYDGPSDVGRYSRYTVAAPLNDTGDAVTLGTPESFEPAVTADTTPKSFQWKTFNDTGKKTCCGGGWVRKFADGTTDWSNLNRLQMDVTKLSCLNYKNELVFEQPEEVSDFNFNQDLNYVCRSPADGGCIQNEIPIATAFEIQYPTRVTNAAGVIDTTPIVPPASGQPCEQAMTVDGPYAPRYFTNPTEIFLSTDQCRNYLHDSLTKRGVSLHLPNYIGAKANSRNNIINDIEIRFMDSNGVEVSRGELDYVAACAPIPNPVLSVDLGAHPDTTTVDLNYGRYCLETTADDKTLVHIAANADPLPLGVTAWAYAGIVINYKPLQSPDYEYAGADRPRCDVIAPGNTTQCDNGMEPGNALYYLTKLARLELLGVPQIFYEPLYCNSNRSKIVGGIFENSNTAGVPTDSREGFDELSFEYDPAVNSNQSLEQIYTSDISNADGALSVTAIDENVATGSGDGRIVFQDKVELPQVFSGHDFKCCIELGEKTPDANKCCSSFASTVNNDKICKLPRGTNLNVYFNKFISSEGIGEDKPGGGLEETDFVPLTGEPKLSIAVNNKIIALGSEYCSSGSTRKGASFGYFFGEPNNGAFVQTNASQEDSTRFSILDSTNDVDGDNSSGFPFFQAGYRWDHQFYCD